MKFLMPISRPVSCFVCVSILLLCMVVFSYASEENVAVICNKSVSEISLSKNSLRNIYLGKKRVWNNGDPITFVTLREGGIHNLFCKIYIKKSTSQFGNYWKHMQFTGKGQIPKSFDTEKEMIKFIANTKGAIGYIAPGQKLNNVKILSIN